MYEDTAQPDAAPSPAGDGPDTNGGDLDARLAKATEDAEKYRGNWMRAEADFQNYKKRVDQERDENRRFAGVSLIINLLPIVDDFERAFGSLDPRIADLTWLDGMRLIYRKLVALLESAGVQPIKVEGESFDPHLHEAVAEVEGPEGKIVGEVQRGYKLHDRVLRPAMVVVGKGSATGSESGVSE